MQENLIQSSKKRKTKFGFAADVFKLATGSALSQIIPILAAPFLTRFYGPESWGILAIFVSVTSIFNVVACLRYELAIMLPEKKEDAANILAISIIFPGIIAILMIPLFLVGKEFVVTWLNAPELGPFLWLIPLLVFIDGLFLAFNYWNSRTKNYGRLSISRVTSSTATVAGKFGFAYAGYANAGTLMYATVAGQIISTVLLGSQILRDDKKLFSDSIRWEKIKQGMVRYRNFPIYSTWAALLNVISLQLPSLLLSFYFSPAVVGLYALGNRILTKPLKFIGNAIQQVFYQRAAAAYLDGTIEKLVRKSAKQLTVVSTFPMLIIAFLGPDLFAFVFGEQWREAGTYSQILVPWTITVFISAPLASLNSVIEKQKIGLYFNIIQIGTRLASLVIGGITGNIFLGLILFSSTGVVTVLWFLAYHIKLCGVNLKSFSFEIIKNILIALAFIFPMILFKYLLSLSTLYLFVISFILGIGYYLYIISNDEDLRNFAMGFVKKKR